LQTVPEARQFSYSAVLVAGGSGSRFASQSHQTNTATASEIKSDAKADIRANSPSEPKQFQPLNGYRLYIWSLSRLYKNDRIENIVVTVPAYFVDEIRRELEVIYPDQFASRISVIAGGSTRQESVYKGLSKLSDLGKPDFVLVHDAARPFISAKTIDNALETVTARGACTIATPVSDTLKRVEQDKICQTINREHLFAVQTPQAAPFDLLWQCHQEAAALGIGVTDDAAILEHFGHEVVIFAGSNNNIKVTVVDDMRACELLASLYLPDTPL
jgi:2-C-methyl-D-erythritol 4-phosphate cytidylyltransferase